MKITVSPEVKTNWPHLMARREASPKAKSLARNTLRCSLGKREYCTADIFPIVRDDEVVRVEPRSPISMWGAVFEFPELKIDSCSSCLRSQEQQKEIYQA